MAKEKLYGRQITAGSNGVSPSDVNIYAKTSTGRVDIILPSLESRQEYLKRTGANFGLNGILSIQDEDGMADINPITIYAPTGEKINGQEKVEITEKYGSAQIDLGSGSSNIVCVKSNQNGDSSAGGDAIFQFYMPSLGANDYPIISYKGVLDASKDFPNAKTAIITYNYSAGK